MLNHIGDIRRQHLPQLVFDSSCIYSTVPLCVTLLIKWLLAQTARLQFILLRLVH